MTRKPSTTAVPPEVYEAKLNDTRHRLEAALNRLIQQTPSHPAHQAKPYRITPAAVAREAGVSRNALYTNHRPILARIEALQKRQTTAAKIASWQDKIEQQRETLQQLKLDKRQLASANHALFERLQDAESKIRTLEKKLRALTANNASPAQTGSSQRGQTPGGQPKR